MNRFKVAIYSGVIPATTFIENLITAVANENVRVYLFGTLIKPVAYNNENIFIFNSPVSRLQRILYMTWYRILLLLKNFRNYSKLKAHINSVSDNRWQRWNYWVKYLPVVLNLPDVFHIQWAKKCGEWMFLKDLFGVKIVLSLRGAHINYSPLANPALAAMYKRVFPGIDTFHAVSNAIGKEAAKYNADPGKIKTIYTAINIPDDLLLNKRSTEGEKSGTIQFISAGRFHWKKGYCIALDALKKLKDTGVNFHYTIVASGNSEQVLYQIKELGMVHEVTVVEKLKQYELFKLYSQSDLLILPSIEEGIANVVLEAMALGIPVISSDCGGMSEVVIAGETGYLFMNHNSRSLFETLVEYIHEPEENREKMIRNAQVYVSQNHTSSGLGNQMKSLYESVIVKK